MARDKELLRNRELLEIKMKKQEKRLEKIQLEISELDRVLDKRDKEKNDIIELTNKLDRLISRIENSNLYEYIELMNNKWKLIYLNFLVGLSRGLGTAIGVTVLAAILVYLLRQIVDVPIIGEYIAKLVEIVQENLK